MTFEDGDKCCVGYELRAGSPRAVVTFCFLSTVLRCFGGAVKTVVADGLYALHWRFGDGSIVLSCLGRISE
jgi:hypothetical protein